MSAARLRFLGLALALVVGLVCATPVWAQAAASCSGPAQFAAAAASNARSLATLDFAPFGRPERGWSAYAPLIGKEIGSSCAPTTPAFAAALARWQARHGQRPAGIMDAATFLAIKTLMQGRRPFVVESRRACPAAPVAEALVRGEPRDSYGGKPVVLQKPALAAYHRMVAAARAQSVEIRRDPRLLTAFSSYRSPDYDTARCSRDGNCDGVRRATCSPHRTGYAVDLYLGQAPGYGPDSTADASRLYLSRTPAYRWLVENAGRYGFRNYPFEPWHWEWTPGAN